MTDLERRIRTSLHAAAEHLPDAPLSETPAVKPRPKGAFRRRGPLVAIAAAMAILVIFGGSILFFGGRTGDEPLAVGEPEVVAIEEFDAEVRPAVEVLLQAPGFQAVQTGVHDNGTVESVWLDYRGDGEPSQYPVPGTWAVVEVVDSDKADNGIFRITATIVTGDSLYTAQFRAPDTHASWFAVDRTRGSLGLAPFAFMPVPLDHIDDYPAIFELSPTDLTRQDTDDGGSIWTMTRALSPEATITEIWGIHPDGHLRSYDYQITKSSSEDDSDPSSRPEPSRPRVVEITFRLQPDLSPHTPPQVGTKLDLDRFELPPEFPVED